MNARILIRAGAALLPAAALTLTSCSSTPKGETTAAAAYQPGVPGGVVVKTFKTTATVTGIDAVERKVTLVTPAGKKTTYKAGSEAINFDQVHIGDQLKIVVAEQLVVFLADKEAPANEGAGALVALAPKGAKPGGLLVGTVQMRAKVTAIDLKRHKAKLQFSDGSSETFPVRPDVDLTQRNVGEEVVIRVTEAAAVSVQKP
jgi:hypothetical protein